MKKYFLILFAVLQGVSLNAQDIHFSQFDNAPLALNPALTGAFSADHRIIGNYRNQWKSVAHPYSTFALSYDMGILKGRLNGGILGLGLQLFNDQAGDNKMGMTEANLSIAYHLPLNRNNFLTAGIQSGITQRRLSQSNMQWDNQYDPNAPNGYNSSLPSGETIGFNGYVFWNISAGMLWSYNSKPATLSSNDAIKATVGAAVFHINQPRHSFYEVSDNKLYMKIVLHGNAFFGIKNTPFSIVPSAVWYNQGPSNEIVVGTLFRYRLKSASRYTGFEKESALALGAYYRVGDAIVAAAQFEWRNFMLTFSYDINISGLTVASRANGGLEVGIRYMTPLFDPKNKSLY